MAQIAAWVATHAPRLMVVDVSVEVAVLVRTMGVPTVVMGMPGERDDRAHQLAYRLADAIIAPWPAWAPVFGGGAPWRAKTHAVGAISRFDGRRPVAPAERRISARARPVRPRRHGADRRHARGGGARDARRGPGRCSGRPEPAGSTTLGRCSARPTSSSRTPGRTRSPTSRPPGGRPSSSPSRDRTTSSSPPRVRCTTRSSPSSARAGRHRRTGTRVLEAAARWAASGWERWSTGTGAERRRRRSLAGAGMRTAVITIVAGRHDHLAPPARRPATDRSITWSSRWATARRSAAGGSSATRATSSLWSVPPEGLPLAHARNAGARRALDAGAELLVFLDVDCIPGPALLQRYASGGRRRPRAAVRTRSPTSRPRRRAAIRPPTCTRSPRRTRRAPSRRRTESQRGGDHALFWTLSFAVTATTWRRIGGFCEDYVGYGGEDTDFGQLAAPRRRRPRLGRRRLGVPPAPPDRDPARPAPRRHPPQRGALPPALGLVADDRLARRRSPNAAWPATTRPPIAGS